MDDLVVRPYEPGDEHAILAAFNLVFREICGPGYVERDLATWHWLFRDNPAPKRIHVAVTRSGVVACQYAGLSTRAQTPVGPTFFNQVVDSFVHPDYRRGLKRPGLFVHTAQPALDLWSQQGDGLFHGVPVDTARRMSIAFLRYQEWRVIDYLCRDAVAGEVIVPASISVRRVTAPSADVDSLTTALAREKTCLALRDRAYLDWRYARNPSQCYEIFEARRDGELVGLSVLRPVHDLLAGACTFAELLTRTDQEEAIDALVATATARARERGRRMLLALFPPRARETAAFIARGFKSVPSPAAEEFYRSIGIRVAQPDLTNEMLAEVWWYSFGDFDLV